MSKLPMLSIVPVGEHFERFQLINELGEFWDGEKFTTIGKPRLYANPNEVSTDAKEFLQGQFGESVKLHLVAPVFIEVSVDPNKKIDIQEFIEYFYKVYSLSFDVSQGYGPQGSLAIPRIAWHRLEQMSEPPQE